MLVGDHIAAEAKGLVEDRLAAPVSLPPLRLMRLMGLPPFGHSPVDNDLDGLILREPRPQTIGKGRLLSRDDDEVASRLLLPC